MGGKVVGDDWCFREKCKFFKFCCICLVNNLMGGGGLLLELFFK